MKFSKIMIIVLSLGLATGLNAQSDNARITKLEKEYNKVVKQIQKLTESVNKLANDMVSKGKKHRKPTGSNAYMSTDAVAIPDTSTSDDVDMSDDMTSDDMSADISADDMTVDTTMDDTSASDNDTSTEDDLVEVSI